MNEVLPLGTQLQIVGQGWGFVGASPSGLGSDLIVPVGGPRGGLAPSRLLAVPARAQQTLRS